jgi:hypothetical protein
VREGELVEEVTLLRVRQQNQVLLQYHLHQDQVVGAVEELEMVWLTLLRVQVGLVGRPSYLQELVGVQVEMVM